MRRRCSDESMFATECHDFQLHAHTKIIGCINGLVCFLNWRMGSLNDMISAIWNPIPPLIEKSAVMPYCVGFGFDSVVNNCKVI